MLNREEVARLEAEYRRVHPDYDKRAYPKLARKLADSLLPELEPTVREWLRTGREVDFRHGDYSLRDIMELRPALYVDAIEVMNEYIRDPAAGALLIFPF